MKKTIVAIILTGFIAVSCIPSMTPRENMTPFQIAQEQVQKIMDAYEKVYQDTTKLAMKENRTVTENKVLEANLKILKAIWPPLMRCVEAIQNGVIPSKIDLDAADDILDLVEGAIT